MSTAAVVVGLVLLALGVVGFLRAELQLRRVRRQLGGAAKDPPPLPFRVLPGGRRRQEVEQVRGPYAED